MSLTWSVSREEHRGAVCMRAQTVASLIGCAADDPRASHGGYPVVDSKGLLVGLADAADIETIAHEAALEAEVRMRMLHARAHTRTTSCARTATGRCSVAL